MRAKVALMKGASRYHNIAQALEAIEEDIRLPPQGLLIKPNFVSIRNQLASTHVEAVRALLDFLRPRYEGSIVIAEGASLGETEEGYGRFGYIPLREEYGLHLLDLNEDHGVEVEVYDRHFKPIAVRVARSVWESPYRISIGPPKIHDVVIVTLSLKNMVVGSLIRDQKGSGFSTLARLVPSWIKEAPLFERVKSNLAAPFLRSDKAIIHQGYPAINLNLYTLAKYIAPHLSIIDGFMAMEGKGPVDGDPVELGIAMASTDFLAADTVAAKIMGFDIEEIGYLHYCQKKGLGTGDLDQIEVIGNVALEECIRPFRPHPTYGQQLRWQISDVERFL